MNGKLILAVPSKGRLQENAMAFLARAGLAIGQGAGERAYRGSIAGVAEAEVAFLSASEITGELAAGRVHLGVTGRDLVEDTISDWAQRVDLAVPLGFGFADVVVAVPEAWIDVTTMADLDDVAAEFRPRHGRRMRVATKYLHLTREFFGRHGIADYRIVESLGATEGAPASGAADLIVDITTTGATLRANGLKRLADGLILKSEAHLVASLTAPWSREARSALAVVLDRIAAEAAGQSRVAVTADPAKPAEAARVAAERFKAEAPFGAASPLTLHVPSGAARACADYLRAEAGAKTVAIAGLDMVFSAAQPLTDRLIKRIDGR
ncbi:MAG: ATP phosphoribosyltransferase [Bauldia sp.]